MKIDAVIKKVNNNKYVCQCQFLSGLMLLQFLRPTQFGEKVPKSECFKQRTVFYSFMIN